MKMQRIGLLLLLASFLSGCSLSEFLATHAQFTREPAVNLSALLISADALPSRWTLDKTYRLAPGATGQLGEEDLRTNFVTTNPSGQVIGGIKQSLYRFRNPADAHKMLGFMQDDTLIFLAGGKWSQPPPPEWRVGERHADERVTRCRELFFIYHCGEIARYGEFISSFTANVVKVTPNMNPAYFTMDDLEAALDTIDAQFVQVLGQTKTIP